MPKGWSFRQALADIVAWGVLSTIFKWIWKLAENAGLGWADDEIGSATGPMLRPLTAFAFEWMPPLSLAVGVLVAYHYANRHWLFRPATAPMASRVELAPSPHTPPAPIVSVPTDTALRHVTLLEAIGRAFLGRWERIPTKDSLLDLDKAGYQAVHDVAVKEVQQFAFDGDLPVWGHQSEFDVLELIPKEAWKTNYVSWFDYLKGDASELCTKVWVVAGGERVAWKNLWTSRVAVDRLWPPSVAKPPAIRSALDHLCALRESGVRLRNERIAPADWERWRNDHDNWRFDVLEAAGALSSTLRARLSTLNEVGQAPAGLSPVSDEHARELAFTSEVLRRIDNYLEKNA